LVHLTHFANVDKFETFYSPRKQEELLDSEEVKVAVDANVLLHLHRYPTDLRKNLFSVLSALENRLWVPFHAAAEYHLNRDAVVSEQFENLRLCEAELRKTKKATLKSVSNRLKRHPTFKLEIFEEHLSKFFDEFLDQIGKARMGLPFVSPTSDKIQNLLRGRVGQPFEMDELKLIEKEGQERFLQGHPPGFRDEYKIGVHTLGGWNGYRFQRRFGDLIIWKELLRKFRGATFVFVTEDSKEDWLERTRGERIPLRELQEEAAAEGIDSFSIINVTQLIRRFGSIGGVTVGEKDIATMKEVRKGLQRDLVSKMYRDTLGPQTTFMKILRDTTNIAEKLKRVDGIDTLSNQLRALDYSSEKLKSMETPLASLLAMQTFEQKIMDTLREEPESLDDEDVDSETLDDDD